MIKKVQSRNLEEKPVLMAHHATERILFTELKSLIQEMMIIKILVKKVKKKMMRTGLNVNMELIVIERIRNIENSSNIPRSLKEKLW